MKKAYQDSKGWTHAEGECVCIGNPHFSLELRLKIKIMDANGNYFYIKAPRGTKVGTKFKYTTHRHGGEHLEKISEA